MTVLTSGEGRKRPGLTVQAFWLMIARTVGFVFSILLPIVLVRVFSPAQFGTYKQAFTIVGTAQALLPFSVGISAFYFLARNPEKSREVVFNIVLYLTIVSAAAMVLLMAWPGLLRLILGNDNLASLSTVVGAIMLTWIVSSFIEIAATAGADVGYSTVFIVTAQASKVILLVGAAAIFRSVEAVLYAALLQGVLQCSVLFWYLQMRFPGFWRHFDKEMAIEQFRYSIPLGVSGFLYAFQADLHSYLVANRFSPAEYAIYAVGTTQVPLIGILRDSVSTVMLPRVSKLQKEGQKEEILRIMLRSWHKLAAALVPTAAALIVLGRDFITVLYTANYLASWPIFVINLSLLVFGIFVTDAVVRAHAEIRFWMVKIRVLAVVVQIVVSLLAIPVFGMAGALLGMVSAFAIERAINVQLILRMLGFNRKHWSSLSGIAGFVAASTIAAVVTIGARQFMYAFPPFLRLLTGASVFALVYIAAVVLMRLLDAEEKEMVNRYSVKFFGTAVLK